MLWRGVLEKLFVFYRLFSETISDCFQFGGGIKFARVILPGVSFSLFDSFAWIWSVGFV